MKRITNKVIQKGMGRNRNEPSLIKEKGLFSMWIEPPCTIPRDILLVINSIPKVTTKGNIRPLAMIKPEINPAKLHANIPPITAISQGYPCFKVEPTITPESPTRDPTARSMPPLVMVTIIPEATMTKTAPCRNRLKPLSTEPKLGEMMINNANNPNKIQPILGTAPNR
jgi:hypothetical protein